MTTYLFTHTACLDHNPGPHHPECPARLKSVLAALDAPAFDALVRRQAPLASVDDLALVHPRQYIDQTLRAVPSEGVNQLDEDTFLSPGSGDAALRAAGAVVAAVDAVMSGEAKNAFCAVRPPGHHAEPHKAMGFCVFNNVAIAARHAQQVHGARRVAIVDFDVHHGNGTQAVAEQDSSLFYASTHQWPLYPGTGSAKETGLGNIVNAPMKAGAGGPDLRHAFNEWIMPGLGSFAPDLLIISAGFDAYKDDPLAGLNWDENDYAWITDQLLSFAKRYCQGRVVSSLEGGYDLAGLGLCAATHVATLMAA